MAAPVPYQPASAYRAALLAARQRFGALEVENARAIEKAVDDWAERLAQLAAQLPPGDPGAAALLHAQAAFTKAGLGLNTAIQDAIEEQRDVTFQELLHIWRSTGLEAAKAAGVPNALLGAVKLPPVTLLGAMEQASGAGTWKTLLTGHVANASAEAQAILRQGLLEGLSPEQLAKRLRYYVQGADSFQHLFTKVPTKTGEFLGIDLGKIPPQYRRQAQLMEFNARRIAYSELANAKHEAQLQHMVADPLIWAGKWLTSPDRGKTVTPDECDVLRDTDFYGLGPGVYPLNAIPPLPHPFDRCLVEPLTRPAHKAKDPKPMPALQLDPAKVSVAGFDKLTDAGKARVLTQVQAAVTFGQAGGYNPAAGQVLAGKLEELLQAQKVAIAKLTAPPPPPLVAPTAKTPLEQLAVPGSPVKSLKAMLDAGATPEEAVAAAKKVFPGKKIGQYQLDLATGKKTIVSTKDKLKAAQKAAALAAPPPLEVAPETLAKLEAAFAPVTPAEILAAATAPGPVVEKGAFATANLLTEHLVQQYGAGEYTAEELLAAVKAEFPKSIFTVKDVEKKAKKFGVHLKEPATGPDLTPSAALAPNQQLEEAKLAVKAVEAQPELPKASAVAAQNPDKVDPAKLILGKKVGQATGSNTAGPSGLWEGQDGVKRYVKQYQEASQAWVEKVANDLYQRLGLDAPEAWVFDAQGHTQFASRWASDLKGTLAGQLTKANAEKVLRGFVADVWLVNYDAVGPDLANAAVRADGTILRLDNGGSLLFRAMGARKDLKELEHLGAWDSLYSTNGGYAKVFKAAGIAGGDDLGKAAVEQIDAVLALEKSLQAKYGELGVWASYLNDVAPQMATKDRALLAKVLRERTELLRVKKAELEAKLAPPTPKAPVIPAAVQAPVAPPPPPPVAAAAKAATAEAKLSTWQSYAKDALQEQVSMVANGTKDLDAAWADVKESLSISVKKAGFTKADLKALVDSKLTPAAAPDANQLATAKVKAALMYGTGQQELEELVALTVKGDLSEVEGYASLKASVPASVTKAGFTPADFNALVAEQKAGLAAPVVPKVTGAAIPTPAELGLQWDAEYVTAHQVNVYTLELHKLGYGPKQISEAAKANGQGWTQYGVTKSPIAVGNFLKGHGFTPNPPKKLAGAVKAAKVVLPPTPSPEDLGLALITPGADSQAALAYIQKLHELGYSPAQIAKATKANGGGYWAKKLGGNGPKVEATLKDMGLTPNGPAKIQVVGAPSLPSLASSAPAPTPAAPLKVPLAQATKPHQILATDAELKAWQTDSVYKGWAYHYTGADPDTIAQNGIDVGLVKGGSKWGQGFYMKTAKGAKPTGLLQKAGASGGNEVQVAVKLKSPLVGSEAELTKKYSALGLDGLDAPAKRKRLLELGYDGVIIQAPDGDNLVIAFENSGMRVVPPPPPPPALPPAAASVGVDAKGADITIRDTKATTHLDGHYKPAVANLTRPEQAAINDYTASGYADLNRRLRYGQSLEKSQVTTMANLDQAIAKNQVGRPVIVYRGLGVDHPLRKLKSSTLRSMIGQVVDTDKGFMSTSTNRSTATSFGSGRHMEIRVPAEYHGWWARVYGTHTSENELILPRGTKVRLLEVKADDTLVVEVVM